MSEPFAQYPYGQYPIPDPPRKHRGRTALGLTATAMIALAAGAGAGVALSNGSPGNGGATATSKTAMSTSQIARNVAPGLVDVNTTLGYQNAAAAGTGIVLTSNGEVLTNNHVVEGATSISVTDIGNGKTYKATVVGYDESKDVAVLQLSGASGLKTASIGDSNTVSAGNQVVALGNAGGKGGAPSVAPGEVTALNQSITASDESSGTTENLTGMIETNADIQPGDSGGSLVNQYGQVIGVDTAASSSFQLGNGDGGFGNGTGGFGGNGGFGNGTGGFGGNGSSGSSSSPSGSTTQGFAIPINTAISIADQIEAGHASSTVHIGATAFLGIEIASTNGMSGSGVEIAGAASGTPAAAAGLTAGDVITSVAGTSVGSGTSIQQVLEGYHPGDKISIGWTDTFGQSHTTTVTLASGPPA
jgi:S1-C subfamily serine protease